MFPGQDKRPQAVSYKARWSTTALTSHRPLPSFPPPAVLDFAEMPVLLVMGQKGSRSHRLSFVTMTTSDDAVLSSPFESRTSGTNRHLLSRLSFPLITVSPGPVPITTHSPHGFFWRRGGLLFLFVLFFGTQTTLFKAFHLALIHSLNAEERE